MDTEIVMLKNSKFYSYCRANPDLFDPFDVPIMTKMNMEAVIDADFQRRETDLLDGRVLIAYTNPANHTVMMSMNDHFGLESGFPIDDFLSGFYDQSGAAELEEGDDAKMRVSVTEALVTAVHIALGLTDARDSKSIVTARNALAAIIACAYDNPLDTIILFREQEQDGVAKPSITNMWVVKARPVQACPSPVVQ